MINLYMQDAKGDIRHWSIEKTENGISIHHGMLNGSMQHKIEFIAEGKAGRSLQEQIESRMFSRVSKMIDKGYVYTIEEAEKGATNALNLRKPMLAQKYDHRFEHLKNGCYIQYKYDGNRCLITKQNGKVFAYSRNGKIIKSIDHILKAAENIPEGCTLDGELYNHGTPLQTIRSWIARGQEDSRKLIYVCYDVMSGMKFSDRLGKICNFNFVPPIFIATTSFHITDSFLPRLKTARDKGYEGLILRSNLTPYQDGKRSKSLVKVKSWEDAEFLVVGVTPSADGWAILECITDDGLDFRVSAPGNMGNKYNIMGNKDKFIRKMITVEYANLTKDGVPFHPVAIAFRDPSD